MNVMMVIMNHNAHYLKLLKIPVWQVRNQEDSMVEEVVEHIAQAPELPEPVFEPMPVSIPEPISTPVAMTLENCTACQLHHGRTQVIAGKGHSQAKLFVVTEAPTFNEDVTGEPFAEEAGLLFDNILKAIHYDASEIYITPYVKCAPYQSFITEEVESQCYAYLSAELAKIQPQKVLLLGRNVAKYLLKSSEPFDVLREKVNHINVLGQSIPAYVSYNPYQLLKFPEEKRKVWKDIKKLMEIK